MVQAGRLAKPSAVQESLKSTWDLLDRSTRNVRLACVCACAPTEALTHVCVCAHARSSRALTPCRRYKDRAREAEIVGWVFVALTIVYFFLMCFMFKRILQARKRGSCGTHTRAADGACAHSVAPQPAGRHMQLRA